jgi:RHH-type rel operon transcriptional repressor/antitoxin RelB
LKHAVPETNTVTVRLARSIEKRIEKLARRTRHAKSFLIREAILLHLEDLEDVYLAEHALRRIREGEDRTIPLAKVLKRYSMRRY